MRLLKTKASFQIFLLIASTFSVLLLIEPVSAEQTYCCEKTIYDQYCQQAPFSQCDPEFNAQQGSCEDTGFCAPVCCILEDSCAPNTGAAQCRALGGTIDAGHPTCEGISSCDDGCCQLGSQCFLSTESACQNLADQFPGTSGLDVWREEITTESACLAVCQSGDLGCCVDVDSGCSYTSRDLCTQTSGSFSSGTYCSDPALFGQCACTSHAEQRCVGDGVYWFDSCGSMEEKIDTCVYADGEVCGEDGDTASCGSVDCSDTMDFPFNTHDPRMGGPRKNGESWCVYEGKVGPGNDLVGSRHYLFSCINGEERVFEQCRDFREEMCVHLLPEESRGVSVAQCIPNDG